MVPVFLGKSTEDTDRLLDIVRIFMPAGVPASSAVVPPILAARRAVQIQNQSQIIFLSLVEGKTDIIARTDVRLWRFQRPITHRQPNRIEARIFYPAKIFGGDKCFPVMLKS